MMLDVVLAAVNGIIIDCSYYMFNGYIVNGLSATNVYTCKASVSTLDNTEAITMITDIGATAEPTLQTADVKSLQLNNPGNNVRVDRFPSNMAAIFPNLIAIEWNGSGLKTLSPSDLAPYPNLVFFFSANWNLLRKLDGNLFQNNHQLQYLDLYMNSIEETGLGLLNGLNSLLYVMLDSNRCIRSQSPLYLGPPYSTLADVQRELDFVCGPSGATEKLEMCSSDSCLANCTARAAALPIRADVVTESVNAPWYYKMRLFFRALSMW